MLRTTLFASAVLVMSSLAPAQVFPISGEPLALDPGDILVTRLGRDDFGPQVIHFSEENMDGQLLTFGDSVTLPAKFVVPTSTGELFVSNGTLFKNPSVRRINMETGEAIQLFTPDILLTGMAYDEQRDILWCTMLAPYVGTQLFAFGPDSVGVPELVASTLVFNDGFTPEDTLNHLTELALDGEGNLYFIVKPFLNGSLNGNDRIARLDADTGELTYLHDENGLLFQLPEGIDAMIAMPDGTLVVNTSPHHVTNLESSVFAIDTEGVVVELFNYDDRFPFTGNLSQRLLAVESEDSFLFPFSPFGDLSETICRYSLSTNEIEVAVFFENGYLGRGSIESMWAVPQQTGEPVLLASEEGQTTRVRPDTKTYPKMIKAMLKAIQKAEKEAARQAKLVEREAERQARLAAQQVDRLPGWRN